MWHVGIDLHREFVVVAAVNDAGKVMDPVRISCQETGAILDVVRALRPFRAVIEASGTYRWLYDLLRAKGTILLAHPLRLRAMIQRRSKTDKLDAQLLANLLRINQIPLAYIPPEPYQQLRDLTRGLAWFGKQDFGSIENLVRDELLERLSHYRRRLTILDEHLAQVCREFPQVEALTDIRGIGLFSALLSVAELGEVEHFRTAKQVGAYAGLTARVHQSGGHCGR